MHGFVFAILYSYPPNFSSFKLETSLAACMQIVFSWGGGFGGGADGDDGYVNIYIYMWLSPFAVHLKVSQRC